MKNITKILITILSLTLLFLVSCGDRPTGSIPGKGDALVNSVPTAKGDIVSDYIDNAYTLTLNFVKTESDITGNYPGGMDIFANYEGEKKYSLTITNSMVVKFGEIEIRTGQFNGTPQTYIQTLQSQMRN